MKDANYLFSENLNSFVAWLEELKQQNKKYVVYGAGIVGNFIKQAMPENIVAMVDQNSSLMSDTISPLATYSLENIKSMTFDGVLISVLGREREIIESLVSNYGVERQKIHTLQLPLLGGFSVKRDLSQILGQLPHLNSSRVFLQIGASNGSLAKDFASKGWVSYAFDANPIYSANTERLKGVENLHFFNMAISTGDEEQVTFYVSDVAVGISSLRAFHPSHRPVNVPAISLKSIYAEHKITAIDLFMIDAETMDLEILKTHNWEVPIKAILIECNKRNIDEITDYVIQKNRGYQQVVFAHQKPTGAPGEMGQYIGKFTVEGFKNLPDKSFGDMLFYESPKPLH